MSRTKNRSEKRRQWRRKLESQGFRPAEIERIIAQRERRAEDLFRATQAREHLEEQEARLERERAAANAPLEDPDDTKYRPVHHDPLTVGIARATGETAKAVRRGSTITGWQHRERAQ